MSSTFEGGMRANAPRTDTGPVDRSPSAGPDVTRRDRSVLPGGRLGPENLLQLQRLAGNAAVAAALQRQDAGSADSKSTGVKPGRFSNSGTSRLGRGLGLITSGPYFLNGIEIVFPLDPGTRGRYQSLRPRQWAGPEAVYFKTGRPLGSAWRTRSRGQGTGADDPLPESQRVQDDAVIYDDSPGFSVLGYIGCTWVHVVQNFTGWVEGVKLAGGSPQRLTEVVAWHSVISVVNPDAGGDAGGGSGYQPMGFTRSGTGWVPTDPPSI